MKGISKSPKTSLSPQVGLGYSWVWTHGFSGIVDIRRSKALESIYLNPPNCRIKAYTLTQVAVVKIRPWSPYVSPLGSDQGSVQS